MKRVENSFLRNCVLIDDRYDMTKKLLKVILSPNTIATVTWNVSVLMHVLVSGSHLMMSSQRDMFNPFHSDELSHAY